MHPDSVAIPNRIHKSLTGSKLCPPQLNLSQYLNFFELTTEERLLTMTALRRYFTLIVNQGSDVKLFECQRPVKQIHGILSVVFYSLQIPIDPYMFVTYM